MKNLVTSFLVALSVILTLGAQAQCTTPTNTVCNYSNNVTTMSWDAVPGAIEYQIEIKQVWDSWSYPEIITTSTTNSLSFTGVMPSLTFDWRVRTHCSADSSGWTVQQFVMPCPEPTNLMVSNITTTGATLTWSPQAGYNTFISDFVLAYRVLGSTGAWTSLGHTSDSSKIISGLTPGVTYEWCVNQTCPYFNSAPVVSTFTTLTPACGVPSNLTSTNVGNTSATLNWSAVPSATAYTLEYKKTSWSNWVSIANLSNTTYTLNNLTMNETYDYRVSATCYSATGAYSSPASFTTDNCHSAGNNSYEWIRKFIVGTINRTSGAEVGGYVNTNLMTDLTIGSRNNRGKIRAGFAGSSRYQNFCVYIDFNGNGDYSDPGERVEGSTLLTNGNTLTFKFNIPNNATPGVVGMRVIMQKNGGPAINGCTDSFIGETEDYLVNLVTSSNRPADNEIIAATEKDENFEVYPNPSTGQYNVEIPSNMIGTKFEVMSLDGKTILKESINNKTNFQFEIANQPQGIYILNIVDEAGDQHIFRLIKE